PPFAAASAVLRNRARDSEDLMRAFVVAVLILVGCRGHEKEPAGRGSQAEPRDTVTNTSAAPGCEDAVRAASRKIPPLADPQEMALAVSDCIRDQWPGPFRQCIATVRDEADFVACRVRHMPDYQPSRDDTHIRLSGVDPT